MTKEAERLWARLEELSGTHYSGGPSTAERNALAALVAEERASEREAIAKMCEKFGASCRFPHNAEVCQQFAKAIRARAGEASSG